jgi:hypothetical protein
VLTFSKFEYLNVQGEGYPFTISIICSKSKCRSVYQEGRRQIQIVRDGKPYWNLDNERTNEEEAMSVAFDDDLVFWFPGGERRYRKRK